MGRQTIFRSESSGARYTVISNKLLQDAKISRETKGLICELMSRPSDWEITVQGMIASGKEGKHKIYKMLKEAKENGYMADDSSAKNGRAGKQTYMISDDPAYLAEKYGQIAKGILKIRQEESLKSQEVAENQSVSENRKVKNQTEKVSLSENQEAKSSLSDFSLPNFSLPKNQPQQSKESNKLKNLTKESMVAPEISDTGTLPLFSSQDGACDLSPPKKNQRQMYSDGFEKFWKDYRKACQAMTSSPGTKREAWGEWQKLSNDEQVLAVKRLKAYREDCRQSKQYMKHGCRYLKYRTWESFEGSGTGKSIVDKYANSFLDGCDMYVNTYGA